MSTKLNVSLVVLFFFLFTGCTIEPDKADSWLLGGLSASSGSISDHGPPSSSPDYGGGGTAFKVPVPPGYDWEVTQSWAEHCEICNGKGYNTIYGGFFGNFCTQMSHSIYSSCKYGWDFNLPGTTDSGKLVLATGDGVVRQVSVGSYNGGWGNCVQIDHGNNICSRYAHLLDGSVVVKEGNTVCQGLIIGKIGSTGNSTGSHLHFQFETCDSKVSLKMGFTDGNGIPVCTMGNDIYNSSGNYSFLKLTNVARSDCSGSGGTYYDDLDNGWSNASSGDLPGCPLNPSCGKESDHSFGDQYLLSNKVSKAAAYLYSECALEGKVDGKLHPTNYITKAEALKVPMYLFGLMGNCGTNVPFLDVSPGDWYYSLIACGVKYGIVSTSSSFFEPNKSVNFAEAAKLLVLPAQKTGEVVLQNPATGNFDLISKSHWAYPYAETLYAYGAVGESDLDDNPSHYVTRGDYVVMAAALSSCYCPNVVCDPGYTCDQESFSCEGSGGSYSPPPPPEPTPDPESDPYVEPDPEPEPDPEDPDLYYPDPEPDPEAPDPYDPYDPPNPDPPDDPDDPYDPPNPDEPYGSDDPTDYPDALGWECNSAVGYTIELASTGGSFETQMSGLQSYYQDVLPSFGAPLLLTFDCADLPAYLAVYGGPYGVQVHQPNDSLPPFGIWFDYLGGPLDDPPDTPMSFSNGLVMPDPDATLLIYIPDKFLF